MSNFRILSKTVIKLFHFWTSLFSEASSEVQSEQERGDGEGGGDWGEDGKAGKGGGCGGDEMVDVLLGVEVKEVLTEETGSPHPWQLRRLSPGFPSSLVSLMELQKCSLRSFGMKMEPYLWSHSGAADIP